MIKEITLNQKELQELFLYDSKTGKLYEKTRRCKNMFIGQEVGYTMVCGYRNTQINRSRYYVHRLIWVYLYGNIPTGLQIDHKDGNKLNNRAENLRLVTDKENSKNMPIPKNNTSGHIGVSLHQSDNKYIAQINVNSKHYHLGSYSDIQDAIKAREAAELKYGFHKNHGRK